MALVCVNQVSLAGGDIAAGQEKNVSKGYKASCRGCHIPAKIDDWIYTEGYPALTAR